MSSIPPIDRIVQSIRSQALQGRGRLAVPHKAQEGQRRNRPSTSNAAMCLVRRIREIRPDDPQRRRRAFRSFLEGSLVDLFGPGAVTDSSYQRVLDRVEDAMSSNPDVSAAVGRVADILLDAARTDDAALAALADALFPKTAG